MITGKSCDGLCVAEEEFEDTSPLPAQCVVIDPLHGRESDYVSCTKRSGKEAIAVSVVTVMLCAGSGETRCTPGPMGTPTQATWRRAAGRAGAWSPARAGARSR